MDIITKFDREWREFEPMINITTQQLSMNKLVSYKPEDKEFELTSHLVSEYTLSVKEARSLNKYLNRMFADD